MPSLASTSSPIFPSFYAPSLLPAHLSHAVHELNKLYHATSFWNSRLATELSAVHATLTRSTPSSLSRSRSFRSMTKLEKLTAQMQRAQAGAEAVSAAVTEIRALFNSLCSEWERSATASSSWTQWRERVGRRARRGEWEARHGGRKEKGCDRWFRVKNEELVVALETALWENRAEVEVLKGRLAWCQREKERRRRERLERNEERTCVGWKSWIVGSDGLVGAHGPFSPFRPRVENLVAVNY